MNHQRLEACRSVRLPTVSSARPFQYRTAILHHRRGECKERHIRGTHKPHLGIRNALSAYALAADPLVRRGTRLSAFPCAPRAFPSPPTTPAMPGELFH
jgi:hypothetical protein